MLNKQANNHKTLVFISLLILLTIMGCGGGGGGSSNTVSKGSDGNYSILNGSVTLNWDAPTTNADGTALTDLAGYKVFYGTSSGNYTLSVDVGNNTGAAITNLSPGTWCFAVTAYDAAGNESEYSGEVCKTI